MEKVEALVPEPDRHLIHPLPQVPMQLPWKVAVHQVLTANAHRFDGRTDLLARSCMRFLSDCSVSLGVINIPQEYVLIITRVRWTLVGQLMRGMSGKSETAKIGTRAAINNVRALHAKVLDAAENNRQPVE